MSLNISKAFIKSRNFFKNLIPYKKQSIFESMSPSSKNIWNKSTKGPLARCMNPSSKNIWNKTVIPDETGTS